MKTANGLETLVVSCGQTTLEVVPERGGIVTRLSVGGEELLYFDEGTLADRSKSVRGGIPILFPNPGKGGKFTWEGKTFELPQHGFARARPWKVLHQPVEEAERTRVTLALESDDSTRSMFPFDFTLSLGLEVRSSPARRTGGVTLLLEAANKGNAAMPFHAGFHPYFAVPAAQKKSVTVDTDATRAFDNLTGKSGPRGALDFTGDIDLHLQDHHTRSVDGSSPGTVLHRGGTLRPISLEWSENGTRLVLWTMPGKDFVCVEPWTAPGLALSTGDPGLIRIEAGAKATLRFGMECGWA